MRKLTLILIAIFALTLSSCKEEEKEHFMFLQFLAEAENPEEFLKSSSYYDSTCINYNDVFFETIDFYSKYVKQEGFNAYKLRSNGIETSYTNEEATTSHFIYFRHKDSYTRVLIMFRKNNMGNWKLCHFRDVHT